VAVFKITQADCAKILAMPKEIDQSVRWSQKGNISWAETSLTVKCEWPGQLELKITVNTELPSKYSMTLLLNQAHRVKGLDVNGSHSNKCTDGKKWLCETHKHDWSESCPDGHAYSPDDITGETIEEVLKQFCLECNINFKGSFRPVPMKPRMMGV
jgi:hypothetical protein